VLEQLLPTEVAYIGILGPRKSTDKMLKEYAVIRKKCFLLPSSKNLHSPVGLDIGAETPEEIALSIISEIQAFFTKKPGGSSKRQKEALFTTVPEKPICWYLHAIILLETHVPCNKNLCRPYYPCCR
jgi:xanthine dehydrogenase accessory factor